MLNLSCCQQPRMSKVACSLVRHLLAAALPCNTTTVRPYPAAYNKEPQSGKEIQVTWQQHSTLSWASSSFWKAGRLKGVCHRVAPRLMSAECQHHTSHFLRCPRNPPSTLSQLLKQCCRWSPTSSTHIGSISLVLLETPMLKSTQSV